MKILVVGGTGMLGHKLIQILKSDFEVFSVIRSNYKKFEKFGITPPKKVFGPVDVEDFEAIENIIKKSEPDFVINAVGVIKQVKDSKDTFLTININSIFPRRLAAVAPEYGFRLINISTDCVFSGKKGNYNEKDLSDAEDLYGKSKYLGEVSGKNCLTVRTSIIGRELFSAHSLIEWFLSNRGGKIKGFKNAIYTGFPTIVFAEIISGIIKDHPEMEGLYHVSSEPINKYQLLKLVNKEFKADIEVVPFEDFYCDRSLDSTKFRNLTGFKPQSWEKMIELMADDAARYDSWRE